MRISKLLENAVWQSHPNLYPTSFPIRQSCKKEVLTLRPTIESDFIISYDYRISFEMMSDLSLIYNVGLCCVYGRMAFSIEYDRKRSLSCHVVANHGAKKKLEMRLSNWKSSTEYLFSFWVAVSHQFSLLSQNCWLLGWTRIRTFFLLFLKFHSLFHTE